MTQVQSNTDNLPKQGSLSGYRFLESILDGVRCYAGPLIELLEAPHEHGGNPGHPAEGMFLVYILQLILMRRFSNDFLEQLANNPDCLELCGLDNSPSESAYSRFKKRLIQYTDLVDQITSLVLSGISDNLERLQQAGIVPANAPPLGANIAIDSTDIEAYGNPKRKRRADPDATWGHRTTKRGGKEKTEPFYGYKDHEGADAYYGLPLGGITLPGNKGDGPQLPRIMAKLRQLHPWMNPKYLMADKAYHGLKNFQLLVDQGTTPIIAVLRPQKDEKTGMRMYDGIYDEEGRPTCIGGIPMVYIGSDPEKGHLFRCRDEGCHLKEKIQWTRHCDSEHWAKPEGRLLRIIGLIPRSSPEWKLLYSLRSSVERYFRSAKHSRGMNQHQFLGIGKISLHVSMSRVAYLVTALAHLKANDYSGMRHMRVKLPSSTMKAPESNATEQPMVPMNLLLLVLAVRAREMSAALLSHSAEPVLGA